MKTKKAYQKEIFTNRLIKQQRILSKWAGKNGIYCYRLYDKDIPEIPLLIDAYHSIDHEPYLIVSLYKRPYKVDENEEIAYLKEFAMLSASLLQVPSSNVAIKIREKKRGTSQYNKTENTDGLCFISKEGEALFYINISDYIDAGLFLDHRPLRLLLGKEAKNKNVLNLFCYTASFSIHAILGGARSVCSVDTSKSALLWAEKNLMLNNIKSSNNFCLVNKEAMTFLDEMVAKRKTWNLIICDPPTFSNSKSRKDFFDVNKDYVTLCCKCLKVLEKGGTLYFSSNSRQLKFDEKLLKDSNNEKLFIKDISKATIPFDFRNKNIHKTWKIVKEN